MVYVYIGVGGFLGAIARFALGQLIGTINQTAFPWGTLTINLLGSFVLGFFLTVALEQLSISAELRLGIATGFLGAFTTFSTFMMEAFSLFEAGMPGLAISYLLSSLVLGLICVWLGVTLARFMIVLPKKKGKLNRTEKRVE